MSSLTFTELKQPSNRKTKRFQVLTAVGTCVGYIIFFSYWKTYAFQTEYNLTIILNLKSLSEIHDFIVNLNNDRKIKADLQAGRIK